jgi:hypothetical protein
VGVVVSDVLFLGVQGVLHAWLVSS